MIFLLGFAWSVSFPGGRNALLTIPRGKHMTKFLLFSDLNFQNNRLNMELDLKNLFGLHVQCTLYSLAETQKPLPPSEFGLIY